MRNNQNFYAVITGTGARVFDNWEQAYSFYKTCPSNGYYKKFATREEAESYIRLATINTTICTDSNTSHPEETNQDISPEHAIAYVNGAFNEQTNAWGYGLVIFPSNDRSRASVQSGIGTAYSESHNLPGALKATMEAVHAARVAGYKRITIYHTFQGVAHWATGAWQTKSEVTRLYANWMLKQRGHIDIKFVNVKLADNSTYTEMAVNAAKASCGLV